MRCALPSNRFSRQCILISAVLWLATLLIHKADADPGEIYATRRAAIVAKFDANGDGWLNAAEREAARAAQKQSAIRRGGQNPMFQMPPEIIEMYDKDKDGQLNDEESQAANNGIRIAWGNAQKEYDGNNDGDLDDAERERMADAILAGKVKGLPRMFGMMLRRPPDRGPGGMFGGRGGPQANPLAQFDRDHDGRLSAGELDAARKAGMGPADAH